MDNIFQFENLSEDPTDFPLDAFELFEDPWLSFEIPEISFPFDNVTAEARQPGDLDQLYQDLEFDFCNASQTPSTTPAHQSQETFSVALGLDTEHAEKIHDSSDVTYTEGERAIWEESVVVFSAQPDAEVVMRKRRRFETSRRREVAMNRLVGACIRCRLRKASCSFGLPCKDCVKRAGSISFGQELCTRQGLVNSRFNNIDLICVTTFGQLLETLQQPFIPATKREISITWPNCCHDTSWNTSIILSIQDTRPFNNLRFHHGGTQTIRNASYKYFYDIRCPDSYSAILPDSLPSLEDLYNCTFDIDHNCNCGPFADLSIAFGKFGDRYCNHETKLPLQNLLQKTIRMKRLLKLYTIAPIYPPSPGDSERKYAPSWVKLQLRHHIGNGVISLEAEILAELDRLIGSTKGIGRRQPIATWVCLWILILAYRTHLAFIFNYFWEDESFCRPRLDLGKHVYNALVSIYSALYKTTSPLILDWRTEEVSEMMGNDPELIHLFSNIKTEMFWFYVEKNQLHNEDKLLRALVLENEIKLLELHKKDARRRGLL